MSTCLGLSVVAYGHAGKTAMSLFNNFVKKLRIFSQYVFAASVARSHLTRGGLNGSKWERLNLTNVQRKFGGLGVVYQ